MPEPQPTPAPDQLSATNQRALDALTRRMTERLLVAQGTEETGELEVTLKLSLHRGHVRAMRWRPDEHLPLDSGKPTPSQST